MAAKKLSILTELTLNAAGFNKGVDGAKEKFNALKGGSEKAASSIKGVFSNMGQMFTPMTSQIAGFTSGISDGIKAFKAMVPAIKSVRTALAATGIGLAVIAISTAFAGLVSWIQRTDEGGDSMRKVFDVIKAVINTILDKLAALGSAIFKLFKGDFKGAGEDAKRAFTGWGAAISDNVKKAKQLNEIQDKLEDYNETALLKKKRIEREISELAEKSRDLENYSAEQRLGFIEKLRVAYKNLYALNNEGFQLELAALKKEQSTNANNQEIRQKINEKISEGEDLVTELNNNLTSTYKIYNKTKNEIAASTEEQKKLNEEIAKQKKEDIKGLTRIDQVKVQGPGNGLIENLTARQNAYNESVKKTTSVWKEFGNEIKSNQALLQNFSMAIDGITGAFTEMFTGGAGAFKNFVTSMLQGLQKIINGLLAQAIAGMIAGEAKKGILGLALGAVGVAALTGLWQAKVPKFESGGIVPGSFYRGDRVPILANSGEMILNRGQQANLFKLLNNGFNSINTGGTVVFELQGSKLIGALNRHLRETFRTRSHMGIESLFEWKKSNFR